MTDAGVEAVTSMRPLILLLMALWALIATLATRTNVSWPVLLGGLENYTQPVAAALVGVAVAAGRPAEHNRRTLYLCGTVLSAALVVNSAIALYSVAIGRLPTELLAPWRSAPGWSSMSVDVMANSASHRRFMGIFNQPAEAGLTYSVALLVTMWAMKGAMGSTWSLLATTAIIVGGALAKSKAFYIGLVVSVLYVLAPPSTWRAALAVVGLGLGIVVLVGPLGLTDYNPLTQMGDRLDPGSGSLISSVTAGRYGSEQGTSAGHLPRIVASPWLGYGLASASGEHFGPDSEDLPTSLPVACRCWADTWSYYGP